MIIITIRNIIIIWQSITSSASFSPFETQTSPTRVAKFIQTINSRFSFISPLLSFYSLSFYFFYFFFIFSITALDPFFESQPISLALLWQE